MKPVFTFTILASLVVYIPASANAQPSSQSRSTATPWLTPRGGVVEAIKPQEQPSKETADGNGWNGAYVGVNAGESLGATAGTNVVVPFANPEK